MPYTPRPGNYTGIPPGDEDFIEPALNERNLAHVDFFKQAELSCAIKGAMRNGSNWQKLTYVKKEALEMIAVKIAHILTSNPHHKNSWHDIAGYAVMADHDCEKD